MEKLKIKFVDSKSGKLMDNYGGYLYTRIYRYTKGIGEWFCSTLYKTYDDAIKDPIVCDEFFIVKIKIPNADNVWTEKPSNP